MVGYFVLDRSNSKFSTIMHLCLFAGVISMIIPLVFVKNDPHFYIVDIMISSTFCVLLAMNSLLALFNSPLYNAAKLAHKQGAVLRT